MTLQPKSYADLSSPVTAATSAVTPARQFTEPLREISALALLAANAVFLALGFSGLFIVLDRWGSDFGLRSAAVFDAFAGPLALGLPMIAMLLATHVAPMVARARLILIVVLVEYAVSALFGAVTFLGAFAYDLSSARATLEGLLERSTWLGLLVLATIIIVRVWLRLFPAPKRSTPYAGYPRVTYGKPYPGQPMYPQPGSPVPGMQSGPVPAASQLPGGFQPLSPPPGVFPPGSTLPGAIPPAFPPPGAAQPTPLITGAASPEEPTAAQGWPVVPPPPMPAPLVVDHDPTRRVPSPRPVPADSGGDATQVVPPPDRAEPRTGELRPPPASERAGGG